MRPMPQIAWSTSGKSTTMPVSACAIGCGYSVTALCHASAPVNAARLCQRWKNVHTPRGRMPNAEARRARKKPERALGPAAATEGEAVDMAVCRGTIRLERARLQVRPPSCPYGRGPLAMVRFPRRIGEMSAARWLATLMTGVAVGLAAANAHGATLAVHSEVRGTDLETAEVRPRDGGGGPWRSTRWRDLTGTPLAPGRYEVRVRFTSEHPGESLQVPPCAGRRAVRVDAISLPDAPGPAVAAVRPGLHGLVIELDVSRYEKRIACGEPPRLGIAEDSTEGLGTLTFESPHAGQGGGRAVVYLPPGHDLHAFGALLVGLHPWNGTPWTYTAYDELLREARARGVLLLMPSGLGNSLYTADAEDEVLRAIDALASVVRGSDAPDPRPLDVSLWGASMGGAGATTIGFHHPDRFLAVTSFFGDSRYDLSTYVRAILRDPLAAHRVNALDIVDNARNLPVWLIHGEDDATSPIGQSEMLAVALQQRGFSIRFDRAPGMGHSGALVAR